MVKRKTWPRGSLVGRSLSSLTAEEAKLLLSNNPLNQGKIKLDGGHVNFSCDSEGSSVFTRVANTTPGMNSMAVFHDVWMAKWNVTNAVVLGVTIVPAAYMSYETLGFSYYKYLSGELDG